MSYSEALTPSPTDSIFQGTGNERPCDGTNRNHRHGESGNHGADGRSAGREDGEKSPAQEASGSYALMARPMMRTALDLDAAQMMLPTSKTTKKARYSSLIGKMVYMRPTKGRKTHLYSV